MATITSLKGTTWQMNPTINVSNIYSANIITNIGTGMRLEFSGVDNLFEHSKTTKLLIGNVVVASGKVFNQYTSPPSYPTDLSASSTPVFITGGSDVSSSSVIGWFENQSEPSDVAVEMTYTVTEDLTRTDSDKTILVIEAANGRRLPSSVTVTGATLDSYSSTTGEIVLSSVSDSVSVTAYCPL